MDFHDISEENKQFMAFLSFNGFLFESVSVEDFTKIFSVRLGNRFLFNIYEEECLSESYFDICLSKSSQYKHFLCEKYDKFNVDTINERFKYSYILYHMKFNDPLKHEEFSKNRPITMENEKSLKSELDEYFNANFNDINHLINSTNYMKDKSKKIIKEEKRRLYGLKKLNNLLLSVNEI